MHQLLPELKVKFITWSSEIAFRLNPAPPSSSASASSSSSSPPPLNPPRIPPLMAGVFPAAPNIPPPGPVASNGAPKTLSGGDFVSPNEVAPKGLKSLNTFLGGLVALGDLVERPELSSCEIPGGEDGVRWVLRAADVCRGGNRPPGTYWKPPSRLFCRNLSVNRLPGT